MEIIKKMHEDKLFRKVNKTVMENHSLNHFNYENLSLDGLLKGVPQENKVDFVYNTNIDGKKCRYNG